MRGITSRGCRLAAMATAAALLFSVAGCTAAPAPPDQEPPRPQPSPPAFVAVLERYAEALQAEGASAVIMQIKARTGEWSAAVGVRSHEGKEPVQLTDQVEIGGINQDHGSRGAVGRGCQRALVQPAP